MKILTRYPALLLCPGTGLVESSKKLLTQRCTQGWPREAAHMLGPEYTLLRTEVARSHMAADCCIPPLRGTSTCLPQQAPAKPSSGLFTPILFFPSVTCTSPCFLCVYGSGMELHGLEDQGSACLSFPVFISLILYRKHCPFPFAGNLKLLSYITIYLRLSPNPASH